MGVGADLHVGAVLALVAEGVHVAHDREGDLALAARRAAGTGRPRSSGARRASAGCGRRPCRRSSGSRRRRRSRRYSASMSPPEVRTRGDRGRPRRRGRSPRRWGRRSGRSELQGALAHDRAGAQRVDDADARASRRRRRSGRGRGRAPSPPRTPGSTSAASMPHAFADDIRRRSSSIRSSVRATSKPPDSVKTPISLYCRTESSVRSVISREWSTGKMKLEAWPVEPPGLGSGALVDLDDVASSPARRGGGRGCCRRCRRR